MLLFLWRYCPSVPQLQLWMEGHIGSQLKNCEVELLFWSGPELNSKYQKKKAENGSADRRFFLERCTGRWDSQTVFGNWQLLVIASGGESYYETRYTCQSIPQFVILNYSWKYQTIQLGFNVQITQWVMFHVMCI